MSILSPREFALNRNNMPKDDYVKGYNPQSVDLTKSTVFSTAKSKKVTLIEMEALRRSHLPSPVAYEKKDGIAWGKGKAFIPKEPRVTYAEALIKANAKPENCSPSPNAYSPNHKQTTNNVGGQGYISFKS